MCQITLTESLSATGMSRTYVSGWLEIAYIYSRLCQAHMDEESDPQCHTTGLPRWKFLKSVPKRDVVGSAIKDLIRL